MYEQILEKELARYGMFQIFAKMTKNEKLSKLFSALARAQEISLISFMRNLKKEPLKESVELSEVFSDEVKIFEEKMNEVLKAKDRKIANNLKFMGVIKKNMAEILEFPEDFKAIYVCPMCGYVVKDDLPDVCPLCNASGESFEKFELIGE